MLIREKDKLSLFNLFNIFTVPVEIWAYGSRVNGTAHDSSDLDLVILTENNTNLPPSEYFELIENIQNSNIPILVEIREWSKLPLSFHNQIEKNHEVFYSTFDKN